MTSEHYTIADRGLFVLASRAPSIPTAYLVWIAFIGQVSSFGSDFDSYIGLLVDLIELFVVAAFVAPALFPSALAAVSRGLLSIEWW